jgi:hypothetical protein
MKMLISVLLIFAFAAAPAQAQQEIPRERGLYGTIGVTQASADVGTAGIDVTAVTGRVGADLGRHFGVEGEASIGLADDEVSTGGTSGPLACAINLRGSPSAAFRSGSRSKSAPGPGTALYASELSDAGPAGAPSARKA